MERQKRGTFVKLLFTASMFVASCSPPPSEQTPLPTPTILPPTETTPTPTPIVTETATPANTMRNPLTGVLYQSVPNPDQTSSGRCLTVERYSLENRFTVFGAATVLGPDPYKYNDHPNFVVYGPDGHLIGAFDTTYMPDPTYFKLVPPGTVVCED